jgi:hypothetical protein
MKSDFLLFRKEEGVMSQNSKYGPLVVVICLGIVLQVILVFASCSSSPYDTAVAFTKAYFKLDPSMADYLCEESKTVDDLDVVAGYIHRAASAAKARGFDTGYVKSQLYNVITETTYISDTEAKVKISASRRTAINPVFAWVAKLFHIGGTYPFEATIDVIKEDGTWKVCGDPMAMAQNV